MSNCAPAEKPPAVATWPKLAVKNLIGSFEYVKVNPITIQGLLPLSSLEIFPSGVPGWKKSAQRRQIKMLFLGPEADKLIPALVIFFSFYFFYMLQYIKKKSRLCTVTLRVWNVGSIIHKQPIWEDSHTH